MTQTIAYLVGSASEDSLNRRLADALILASPKDLEFVEAPIVDLPFYRPELDREFPEAGTRLKQIVEDADGVLMVTPEYNRCVPAVLKNALDWLSRPAGDMSLAGKPVMVAGASGGATSAGVAVVQLRSMLTMFNVHLMSQPELFVNIRKDQFGSDGRALTEGTQEHFEKVMGLFAEYVGNQPR
ncbi:MAG: NAD(P)H-dependent oxidoreductase [Actinomyces sp.]|jgi:chromate reductase|nr:NAD(P)H-dependent oxidoreductase [Actinomyces sp.]MCI1787187.1 NAD(P)H-dependent oxidoreductase [Actinomyces sp.]MCI1829581.1 NAD(P)H-dependent oxidoreductase [Actinomyces sp.]MCI1866861.1 NAD(P)H-dependent oxidoreductase [Actinomyces sp.]